MVPVLCGTGSSTISVQYQTVKQYCGTLLLEQHCVNESDQRCFLKWTLSRDPGTVIQVLLTAVSLQYSVLLNYCRSTMVVLPFSVIQLQQG